MGIQGLRKFIGGSSCTYSAGTKAHVLVEHVLLDMNSIIHSCFSKHHESAIETIQAVIDHVVALLRQITVPTKTLTLVFDGPAPVAKLLTQRLRRRKLSNVDLGNNTMFCNLSITTGSPFMVELENRLARHLQQDNVLEVPVPVFLYGSCCIGEGESKISTSLAYIVSNYGLSQFRMSDQVVIYGNDIDLTLTSLGATPFHNLFIIGPTSLQVINVGDLMYRWLLPSSNFLVDVAQLPSTRIDLIFLFLLNGGDHYVGLGDAAVDIWRRYRLVRIQQPYRSIVSEDLQSVDIELLSDVLLVSEYTGSAEVKPGTALLVAALWSTYTTVTGNCPNYRFVCSENNATLCNVKAALATKSPVKLIMKGDAPLTPLATYVALMPTLQLLPEGVRKVVVRKPALAKQLLESYEPRTIAAAASEAVQAAIDAQTLNPTEALLNQFASPVHINFHPKPKQFSRYELHRRMKEGEPLIPDAVPPEVVVIAPPPNFNYQSTVYPVKELIFLNPFASEPVERRVAIDPSKLQRLVGVNRLATDAKASAVGDNDDELLRFLGEGGEELLNDFRADAATEASNAKKKKKVDKVVEVRHSKKRSRSA